MKTDDSVLLGKRLRRVLDGATVRVDTLTVARSGQASSPLRHGFHSQDAWEIFCVLRRTMRFEVVGHPHAKFRAGAVLIVPPDCLHMVIDLIPQHRELRVLIMHLPGTEGGHGSLLVGGVRERSRSTLSAHDLAAWTALLGEPPTAVMQRVEQALDCGIWGRERALGHLRVLLAAYAEIATGSDQGRRAPGERRVAEAMAFLQSHYYEADLSLPRVAAAVGLSPSHLSFLVRQTTGQSIHQMLVDLRLRRAMALLTDNCHTIKEIASLTGWSHQLYFSSAFRKRHGAPPSAYRIQAHRPPSRLRA